jgi:hypothetical protein
MLILTDVLENRFIYLRIDVAGFAGRMLVWYGMVCARAHACVCVCMYACKYVSVRVCM